MWLKFKVRLFYIIGYVSLLQCNYTFRYEVIN